MLDWSGYILRDFSFTFAAGSRVLDVGCGEGAQLAGLVREGISAYGLDTSLTSLRNCETRGAILLQGRAENLPFPPKSFDGVLCKAALPYTNERSAIREIGRVLRPGGIAYLVTHGSGYYLRYLLRDARFAYRIYGARSLLNSWMWATTGRRLPNFLGDTIYQSRKRLNEYYRVERLDLIHEWASPKYLGFPVFLYHLLRRSDS
jgi:SAM-dependent methyltransferase